MLPIDRLGLSAQSWEFMRSPERYVQVSKRPLVPESTARQLRTAAEILARLNGSFAKPARRGVLLADDVGLGKTTVAALALSTASAKANTIAVAMPALWCVFIVVRPV